MNTVVISCAGSGKTTYLASQVGTHNDARILITTYTNENADTVRERLIEKFGCVPANVTVATWYSVLLAHGVRPYQNLVTDVPMPRATMLIRDLPDWAYRVPKASVARYYFTGRGDIYLDRTSEFVCFADERTGGLIVDRLQGIFTHIFVDELQDLAGYDLELLKRLFQSRITIVAVGDPRQGTYSSNRGRKNSHLVRSKIVKWIDQMRRAGLVAVEEHTHSWRSNQAICDFADSLYPDLPKTQSKNEIVTDHDGIFEIASTETLSYFEQYHPVVLRYNKSTTTLGLPAMNIGVVKGKTYDRVLLFPTSPMKKFVKTREVQDGGDLARFYVAVTRARFSVAIVM